MSSAKSVPSDSRNDRAYAILVALTALGVSLAVWKDNASELSFFWLSGILFWCAGSIWPLPFQASSQAVRTVQLLAFELVLIVIWCVPVVLWFEAADVSTQLVMIVFYFVAALAGTVVRQTHPIANLTSAGLALPFCAWFLWQSSGTSALFATAAISGAWVSILALGWTLRLAFIAQEKLRADRSLLLERLSQTLEDLETSRQSEANARESADEANRDKSRFLAHVSHDLRQPVHAARLLMESLPDETYKTEQHGGALGQVRRSVSNLAHMFDALLDTAMLESGQNRVTYRQLALSQIFSHLSEECSELADRAGFELRFQSSGYEFETDPVVLSRMIRNLVVNAIQHSEGTAILVGARQRKGCFVIEVRDNGRGIEPAERDRIFEEFQRLEHDQKGTPSSGRNLGLGLSIVQRLARVLGCKVQLKSLPGRGSCFSIGPFKIEKRAGSEPAGIATSLSVETCLHILVVEDDPDTRNGLAALLQKWGHDVQSIADGELSGLSEPDLIIADYHLGPELTGLQVINEARKRWHADIPAFVITGETAPELVQEISDASLRCLPKPTQPVALKSAILASQARARAGAG